MFKILNNQKGFTLIELMFVVIIIGILSSIAISNFLEFRLKAKTLEAESNLGSIRACEEAYKAEYDFYLLTTPNPARIPGKTPLPWTNHGNFAVIGFDPPGKVYYRYDVDPNGSLASSFKATAEGNLDGDKATSIYQITNNNNITHRGDNY